MPSPKFPNRLEKEAPRTRAGASSFPTWSAFRLTPHPYGKNQGPDFPHGQLPTPPWSSYKFQDPAALEAEATFRKAKVNLITAKVILPVPSINKISGSVRASALVVLAGVALPATIYCQPSHIRNPINGLEPTQTTFLTVAQALWSFRHRSARTKEFKEEQERH